MKKKFFISTTALFLLCLPSFSSAEEPEPASFVNAVNATIADEKAQGPSLETQPVEEFAVSLEPAVEAAPPPRPEPILLSEEFLKKAWELSGQNDVKALERLAQQCLDIYGEKAKHLEAQLSGFPIRGQEKDYQILNDVATVLFVRAEALMNTGKTEEAVPLFQEIIDQYRWAQAWDPSRGGFWSVAEKSQASIDVITGKMEEREAAENPVGLRTRPRLIKEGAVQVVDYRKFGEFVGVGTKEYSYKITKNKELAEAIGGGIYPSNGNIFKDENYKKVKAEGRLEGKHWDFILSTDLEAAYYKWLTAPEPTGLRLFYLGIIFEKAKMYPEAIKAYHAIVVHFPTTVAWTYWQTPWYPAQAAVAKIKHIVRSHPELNLTVRWMKVEITNGFDNDVTNDVIVTYPGVIEEKSSWDRWKERFNREKFSVALGKVKKKIGAGTVQLVQYEKGHWQLLVDGRPYVIRGITYAPTKTGQSPDKKTLVTWMHLDSNNNGILDGPYESWVDANRNNQQDADEPVVGDFQLLKDLGVNTLREYYQPDKPDKAALREMYNRFGFRVMMGNFLGKYTLGSGARWFEGTDYENPDHQKKMMESVREMVTDMKDEPYILLWVLGNENNYGVASNADKKPEAYFKFANEVARMIKSIDPNHPVALCNGDTLYLDLFAKYAPDIDIFAANVYRGDYGFGSFWDQVFDATGKPAFITEYGSPAYAKHLTLEEGEEEQAKYHRGNWLDIEANLAGRAGGAGNALGGAVFEWADEWWKNYEPFYHDRKSDAIGPFVGGYYYEEWFGITAQGNGKNSPFLRQLRKSYFAYQDMWRSSP